MQTVSDFIVHRLSEWGVRRVYGYPGDGINGVMGALRRAAGGPDALRFIQVAHEELAAFMACAHAKFTGELGVCIATSGPGAIHLLNGLYDARADHQPVLAIVGQQARSAMGGDYQQEVDLLSAFKDVARDFVQVANTPQQARHLVDRAARIALDRRAPTCIILPNDVQELKAVAVPPREHGTVHSGIGVTGQARVPDAADLRRAADVLNAGSRVAMLVGAGALNATDEIIEVAECLGAGVAKALLGKAAVPDDLPFVTGAIGLIGTTPSWKLMEGCDTLLMVGSAFPYSEFLPSEGQARGVQIDIDGRMLNLRYPMEVGLVGDSKATLGALLPYLERKPRGAWRAEVERDVARWWRVLDSRAAHAAHPINPQRPFHELSARLPDRCILTCDSGSVAAWYARDLKVRRGMMASVSGGLASMGSAVPYALTAKLAHPDRAVIAVAGDGAMQMNGINSLIDIAKYWREWTDPRLIIVVLNNRDLNMVTWEQRLLGQPKFAASQDLPDFRYADYARMLGLGGVRIEHGDSLEAGWDVAFAERRPVVVDILTDPDVPILPPHITMKQARAYAEAVVRGDANAAGTLRQIAREVWSEWFPGGAEESEPAHHE